MELDPAREIKALAEVPRDALLGTANAGEVDPLVPSEEKLQVGKQLADLVGSQPKLKGCQESADVTFAKHVQQLYGLRQ